MLGASSKARLPPPRPVSSLSDHRIAHFQTLSMIRSTHDNGYAPEDNDWAPFASEDWATCKRQNEMKSPRR